MWFRSWRMVKAGTSGDFPNMSLAKWGKDVPRSMDRLFKRAQSRMKAGRQRDALRLFDRCLQNGVAMQFHFPVLGCMHILLLQGYCHAELGEFERAFEYYESREGLIRRNPDRTARVPEGIQLIYSSSFLEAVDQHLAVNFLEKGFAAEKMGRIQDSVEFLTVGARHAVRAGDREYAFKLCEYIAGFARERQDWPRVAYAGELIEEVCGDGANDEQKWRSHWHRFFGYFFQDHYERALELSEEMLRLERSFFGEEQTLELVNEARKRLAHLQAGGEADAWKQN